MSKEIKHDPDMCECPTCTDSPKPEADCALDLQATIMGLNQKLNDVIEENLKLQARIEKIKTCSKCSNEYYKAEAKDPCPWCIADRLQVHITTQQSRIKELGGEVEIRCRLAEERIEEIAGLRTQLAEAKGENMKLNIILFHRENGLSHPDLKGEIKKSKMAEQLAKAEGENELLKAQLSKYLNEPETLTTTEAEQAIGE